jgi:hypothetical protein
VNNIAYTGSIAIFVVQVELKNPVQAPTLLAPTQEYTPNTSMPVKVNGVAQENTGVTNIFSSPNDKTAALYAALKIWLNGPNPNAQNAIQAGYCQTVTIQPCSVIFPGFSLKPSYLGGPYSDSKPSLTIPWYYSPVTGAQIAASPNHLLPFDDRPSTNFPVYVAATAGTRISAKWVFRLDLGAGTLVGQPQFNYSTFVFREATLSWTVDWSGKLTSVNGKVVWTSFGGNNAGIVTVTSGWYLKPGIYQELLTIPRASDVVARGKYSWTT